MKRQLLFVLLLGLGAVAAAEASSPEAAMRASVEQLRSTVGEWDVTTEFLNDDGSVARAVRGSYEFTVVVPDRVLAGRSDIPELQQSAGILFYIREKQRQIEMVSVGADGRLWIMTGELGGEVRYSQEFKTAAGGTGQLRFTRSRVLADSFESRMDYSEDGGVTWKPGNHQVFRRKELAPRESRRDGDDG